MFETVVRRHRFNRREALGLGAAAAAAALLSPRAALAARPALFELALDGFGAGAGWRESPVLRAPRRFDLIGLRWARGARLDAQVRARRRGGEWTRWVPLAPVAGHAPDGAGVPAGTEPAWTGAADVFQLRLRGQAPGLRARFVRSPARGLGPARIAAAQAATPPPIIPRSAWGADGVPPRAAPSYGSVQLAFVHHTATANAYAPQEAAGVVLGIARYHRDAHGWNDMGYNFLVDQYGQVFEGRAGGVDQAVVGAHAQGYNAVSTGIACLGTYEAVGFTEAGMAALARLIGWKLALHGAPVDGAVTVTSAGGASSRHPVGSPVTFQRVSGHRDGDSTSCPGAVLYAALAEVRSRAHAFAVPVSRVTLQSAARRVRGATPTSLAGDLHFADGSSPAGAPLDVELLVAGGAWQRVGGATCGLDGRWAATVVLPASGSVRAVFAGDATRPRLESAGLTITVVPVLTLALSPRRLRAGHVVRVTGTLAPARAIRVTCVVERRVGRRWVRVQRKRINVRGGRFATRVRRRRAGLYRVSISAPNATIRRLVRVTR